MRENRTSARRTASKKELVVGAIVVVVLVSLGIVKLILQGPSPPEAMARPQSEAIVSASDDHLSTRTKAKEKIDAERKRSALAAIAEHEATVNANW
ncbi:MAG: hypothetical protein JSV16_16715, partial [Candidatus Hydrogenedentota bacterium]